METPKTPEQHTLDEIAEIEKAQKTAEASLIKEGFGVYLVDKEGNTKRGLNAKGESLVDSVVKITKRGIELKKPVEEKTGKIGF